MRQSKSSSAETKKSRKTAPSGRRLLAIAVVVPLCFLVLASTLGCSLEARAKRGLKKVFYTEIKQFNKYHQREVKPNVYQSGGKFYRTFKERVDASVNMRRTNSVDTPYVATITYTEDTYLTRRRATSVEAQKDVHFVLSSTRKGEIVYTFVNGSWKKKEIY